MEHIRLSYPRNNTYKSKQNISFSPCCWNIIYFLMLLQEDSHHFTPVKKMENTRMYKTEAVGIRIVSFFLFIYNKFYIFLARRATQHIWIEWTRRGVLSDFLDQCVFASLFTSFVRSFVRSWVSVRHSRGQDVGTLVMVRYGLKNTRNKYVNVRRNR